MKHQFVITHQYTVLQQTEKAIQIRNRPVSKHVMLLWKHKDTQFFAGKSFWQKVCLQPSCVVMWESQSHELWGLHQIAVPWACSCTVQYRISRSYDWWEWDFLSCQAIAVLGFWNRPLLLCFLALVAHIRCMTYCFYTGQYSCKHVVIYSLVQCNFNSSI